MSARRPIAEWVINTQEAAEILHMTPTRVRQLAAEDPAFPAPLRKWSNDSATRPHRWMVWWKPEIEEYARIPRPNHIPRRLRHPPRPRGGTR